MRSGKSWFSTDDTIVKEVPLAEVLGCEAYLLFYERVGDLDPPPTFLVALDKKKDKTESQGASESQKHGNDEGVVPVDPIVAAVNFTLPFYLLPLLSTHPKISCIAFICFVSF